MEDSSKSSGHNHLMMCRTRYKLRESRTRMHRIIQWTVHTDDESEHPSEGVPTRYQRDASHGHFGARDRCWSWRYVSTNYVADGQPSTSPIQRDLQVLLLEVLIRAVGL